MKINKKTEQIMTNEIDLKILRSLLIKSYSLTELAEEVGIAYKNLLPHVRKLEKQGWLMAKKEKNSRGQMVIVSSKRKDIEGRGLIDSRLKDLFAGRTGKNAQKEILEQKPYIGSHTAQGNEADMFVFKSPRYSRNVRNRTIEFRDYELAEQGYLQLDVFGLADIYMRHMVPDLFITKYFGDPNAMGFRVARGTNKEGMLKSDDVFYEDGLIQIRDQYMKLEEKETKDDDKLEEYSKGVQARIAKLTRKMREAERREQAAVDYAKAVEQKRLTLEKKFEKTDSDYIKKFESTISSGLEAAQKELAAAIESGDATAQVEANKRIATLAFENAKLEAAKEGRQTVEAEKPVQNLSQGGDVNIPRTDDPINPDPRAEAWASKNSWFGTDRAMTYTAFEIHKDLTEKEGYDPSSDEYYAEVDKRIRVDFPHKFGTTETKQTAAPVQTVASANRSVKPGRKTVKLTSSQVAIAKKLGVPLEEYAKQLKNTEGA